MMKSLAENLWLIRYPLPKLGADLRRNVSIIRLSSGKLVIHSTGPFTPGDVAEISTLGEPGWLVDSMLDHDTYADEGRAAFPLVPYLAPPDFSKDLEFPTGNLLPAPPEWGDELQVIELAGMPSTREHIFFHAPSRTLIVADMIFNFGDDEPVWTEIMLRLAVGGEHHPGIARPFKAGIKDEEAFREAVMKVLAWDFDRVVCGHGDVIETGAKAKVSALVAEHLLPAQA